MLSVGLYDNQPSGAETAVLGNLTYSADISAYRNEILTITSIPELDGVTLFAAGFGALALRRRRI